MTIVVAADEVPTGSGVEAPVDRRVVEDPSVGCLVEIGLIVAIIRKIVHKVTQYTINGLRLIIEQHS